ncbi:MAG TPA: hypothetical protein PKI11_13690 [Candidatus Hydrogenedentes bacterium]|nr:hypothetical protein [Candidatus Hydrogenedentota bacterium]HNT88158.1 hypothetical protein [Candidatus Hydrogenedentota bacterium]
MKHLAIISARPRRASLNATPGQIIAVVAQLMTVVATALLAKEGTTG